MTMSIHRLQLTLIPDSGRRAQPLPADVQIESVELIARMLIHLVHLDQVGEEGDRAKEAKDESR
jgi:hypothetical protein